MDFFIGDLVTRNSYKHDTVFKIIDIKLDTAYLKGVNMRICADSDLSDLKPHDKEEDKLKESDRDYGKKIHDFFQRDRDEFFYLPGKILHIDGDEDYLNRCMKFYKEANIKAFGICLKEKEIAPQIRKYLEEINPDVVIITGHDAFFKDHDVDDNASYKNTIHFINGIKEARKYEKSHDKLIIIAGACQSNYEELIKAGANFASSPKRINIHALDPAIIASSICLTDRSEDINLIEILKKTKYGKDGMGGVITKGMMYVGYPR